LRSGADVDALYIDGNQNVGIGTDAPGNRRIRIIGPSFDPNVGTGTSSTNVATVQVTSTETTGMGAIAIGGNDNCGIFNSSGIQLGLQSRGDMNFYVQDVNTDKFGDKARRMTIANNGNIGVPGNGTAIYNASDQRLKENIVNLTNSLNKINQMQGVQFNWIPGFCDENDGRISYGLIAQDVQSIDANLVNSFTTDSVIVGDLTIENPLTVNEKYIIPMLVEAVKELSAKVTALEGA